MSLTDETYEVPTDHTEVLSVNEWLEFLNYHMRSSNIDEEKRTQMAQTLFYHFMSIDDVLQLTEQELVSLISCLYDYFSYSEDVIMTVLSSHLVLSFSLSLYQANRSFQ